MVKASQVCRINIQHTGEVKEQNKALPVLLNETFILSVWFDGFEGIGHLIMNAHHFILEKTGQVKIFLHYLLPRGKNTYLFIMESQKKSLIKPLLLSACFFWLTIQYKPI